MWIKYSRLNIAGTSTFLNITRGGSNETNHLVNCNVKCMIDVVTCSCCGKQHIEESDDELSLNGKLARIMIGKLQFVNDIRSSIFYGPKK